MNLQCSEVIADILDYFEIEYKLDRKKITGTCPVHGGDNDHAFCIYYTGQRFPPNWKCWTHFCEDKWGVSLISLVHALLRTYNEKEYTTDQVIDFIKKFLNDEDLESPKKRFIKKAKREFKEPPSMCMTREEVRHLLVIPSKYFIQRGYSPAILRKYLAGYCPNKKSQMKYRSVIPIFDQNGKYVIGCSGRTIYPVCPLCKNHHYPNQECKYGVPKWKYSIGLDVSNILFNLWNARAHCSKRLILTESPLDVLRLEQAGLHNSVACLGAKLTDGQKILIDMLSPLEIVIPAHNDEAGEKMYQGVLAMCQRDYNIKRVYIPEGKSDIGDMKSEEVKCLLG